MKLLFLLTVCRGLGIWTQFKWETNVYGTFIHPAFISDLFFCRDPVSWSIGSCKLLLLFRLQGQLLINPGCSVVPVRSRQVMVADLQIRQFTALLNSVKHQTPSCCRISGHAVEVPWVLFGLFWQHFMSLQFGIFSFSEIFYHDDAHILRAF